MGRVAISLAGCDFGNSGVGVFAQALVPRLVEELAQRGFDSRIIGSKREHEGLGTPRHARVIVPSAFDPPGRNALLVLGGLPILARSLGAQVLYLPAANRRLPFASLLPMVGTVHDLAQFHVTNKYGLAREVYVKRVLTPLIRRLSCVLAVSQATADDLVRLAKVPSARVRVVPNGISVGEPSSRPSRRPRPYVLYACRLEHPGKNHERLLEAFARSNLRHTHDLVLSGKDWGALERIERQRATLGIADRVDVVGFVSREELIHLTTHADAAVVAGLFEGFGLPAAEALAFGRPLACSNTGSLPEVAGDLAAYFDPTDVESIRRALERAIQDETLRARCREQGPAWVKRFSWDECARAVASAITEAVR